MEKNIVLYFCFSPGIGRNNVNNISMVLGNDTKCANTLENPCNGPLKASTSYRYVQMFLLRIFVEKNEYK